MSEDNGTDNSGHAGQSHGAGASNKRLTIALSPTSNFLVVELVAVTPTIRDGCFWHP